MLIINFGIIMNSKMDLNGLRIFVSVASHGSFIAAAKTLKMPSSNVSRAVSQLEHKLGLRLLERSTRQLKLTEAGQLLYSRSRPMIETVEETQAELTSQQALLKGPLRVCIPNEIGPALLATIFAEFALKHPEIEMSCTTNLLGLDSLQDGIDLAVIVSRGQLDDSNYVARRVATIPCFVVASPALIARCGMPTKTSQLETLPCITTVSALKGAPWQFAIHKAKNRFKTVNVNAVYRANSGEMAFAAAVAGVGFAILSRHPCKSAIEAGQLVEVELEYAAAPLHLFALYSSREYLPAKTRALVEFIQQKMQVSAIVPTQD
jgi:DNA-binding transcriptional LysR family regulator